MNITESSKATTAAPAVDQPIAESSGYVGGKSTVEDPSTDADKVSIYIFIKFMTWITSFGYWPMVIGNAGSTLGVNSLTVNDLI